MAKVIQEHTGRRRAQRLYKTMLPCERCGGKSYDRHHIDGNTLNNAPGNIQFLCRKCHMLEDGRLAAFKAIGKKWASVMIEAAANIKRSQTHCKRNHPLSGDNLYVKPNGTRVCKTCRMMQSRLDKQRKAMRL